MPFNSTLTFCFSTCLALINECLQNLWGDKILLIALIQTRGLHVVGTLSAKLKKKERKRETLRTKTDLNLSCARLNISSFFLYFKVCERFCVRACGCIIETMKWKKKEKSKIKIKFNIYWASIKMFIKRYKKKYNNKSRPPYSLK